MHYLGYDLGSSSVKACLLDAETGLASARAVYPDEEMAIDSPRPGWAEQSPEVWWRCVKKATERLLSKAGAVEVGAIGISYQMHGLVLVDRRGEILRPSIIWCDSRAVEIGNRAFSEIGPARCLEHLLNSPGNFTASRLRWVRENEPALFDRIHKVLLPGDYLAFKLTGRMATTVPGLSEAILWDFADNRVADFLLEHYGLSGELLPEIVPTFGEQGRLTRTAARELGLAPGVPVTYRAGDQPNNALALNVFVPGEVAATAGTSGVVYGVTDTIRADPASRVNSFAHVNHSRDQPRLGVLLCINGCGSANRWLRRTLGGRDYETLNREAAQVSIGSKGLLFYPFGNGAERMLENREPGAAWRGLHFNLHSEAHLARAVQEGVAFSFRYGMGILEGLGLPLSVIRAGLANMFLSAVFRETLSGTSAARIELFETDGAEGAARGAAIEVLEAPVRVGVVEPDGAREAEYQEAYQRWADELER